MPLKDELNGYLRLPRAFFGIPAPESGDPDVGVVGVPYDMTSSYLPGPRFGPDTIRQATDSERSHSYPLSLERKDAIDKSLTKMLTLEDVGDLEIALRLPEAAAIDISEACTKLASRESRLLFLGGDHFISYPILKGLKRGRPGRYGLVYLDAHADLYSDMGGYQLSHATGVRRMVDDELVLREDIAAYDLRSALPAQREEMTGSKAPISSKDQFHKRVKEIGKRVEYIYISVDIDVLSPQVAPGVSHPESGGLSMIDLVELLRSAFETGKVRYADVVELNPLVDTTGITAFAARDIVKEILTGFAVKS
ncbi:MAG: Guanidinobutyrase [Candidatus Thorarchaeota archaeon AB_25]|nr:MAG: Guanidinobutyrase [Candidatus Thorarchaeota archaeon AB_25]